MPASKMFMKALSLFVLFSFVGSLGVPVVQAAEAAQVAQTMTNAAKTGLGDLWFFWGEYLKNLKVKPTREAAYTFFQGRGATEQQALALTGNAEASGHLSTTLAKASQASQNVFSRFFGKLTGAFKPQTEQAAAANTTNQTLLQKMGISSEGVQATVTPTLSDRVRAFFSRFKGGAAAASSSGANAQNVYGETVAASGSAAASGGGTSLFSKIGSGVSKVADSVSLTARRAGSAVGGTAKTGWLTLGDKLDFNRYYEIPVTDSTAIKVRGEFKGVTKFTDGGWVVEKYVGTSKTPGSLGEQLGQIEMLAAKPEPTGFFGKIFSKFKGSVTNVKNKMTGKGYTQPETQMELQKLKVEGNLLEQARMLNEAQRAIKYRMDHLVGSANSLRKPVPEHEIAALQKQYDAIERTKHDLARKVEGIQDSPTRTVVKDAARWALYSIGITASVNLIKQAFSGEGIDIKKAFAFMAEPQFWGGTAGGFLGSTLLTTLAAGIMPPGAGLFLRILPGFLGAALGFEVGASLFGGQMDLLGSIVQTLASAGGYTLAVSMIGPGLPALLAAIAAGSLASILLNKLRGGFQTEAYTLPPEPIDQTAASDIVVADQGPAQTEPAVVPAAPGMNMAELEAKVKDSYNNYINFLKLRKLSDARKAHQDYTDAKEALDGLKASSSVGN